jgi:hypothetical protein
MIIPLYKISIITTVTISKIINHDFIINIILFYNFLIVILRYHYR